MDDKLRVTPLHVAIAAAAWQELVRTVGPGAAALSVRDRIGSPCSARRRVQEVFDFSEDDAEDEDLVQAASGLSAA